MKFGMQLSRAQAAPLCLGVFPSLRICPSIYLQEGSVRRALGCVFTPTVCLCAFFLPFLYLSIYRRICPRDSSPPQPFGAFREAVSSRGRKCSRCSRPSPFPNSECHASLGHFHPSVERTEIFGMPLPVQLTTIKVTHGRGPRAAAARSRSWIEIEVPLRTLTNHSVQSSERRPRY